MISKKKYFHIICMLTCMAFAVETAGCSLKNKSREISDEDKQRYESLEIEENVKEAYPELDITFESIDVDKMITVLTGEEIDKSKVVVTEENGDFTSFAYETETKSCRWNIGADTSFSYYADEASGSGKIDAAEADRIARQIIDACGLACEVDSHYEVESGGDAIWLSYSFMYDGTPILGNRTIALDKHDMDSPSLKTAYIECGFDKGVMYSFSIDNVPAVKESNKMYYKKDFIGIDRLLSIVDSNMRYGSADDVLRIGIRYLPLSGDDILHYVPVYEVSFKERTEESEDTGYIMDSSMLVDAYTGECYD